MLDADPGATLFPTATGTLERSSLGVGARFTTLHWPAVEWAMAELSLSMTANQNSIPRELVYDVDVMLSGRLEGVPFDPRVALLMPKCLNGAASVEETMLFQQLWQARVRTLLLDHADDAQAIVVRH